MLPLSSLPCPSVERRGPALTLGDADRSLLNQLRLAGMRCRTAARVDLFEACALLTLDGEDARRTYLETLVRCLSDAVHKQIIWFSPGSGEVSFDEAWVLRCFASIRAEDRASLAFLLKSRVAPSDQRYIGFLLARISEQFARP